MSPEAVNDTIKSRHIRDFAAVTRRLLHGSRLFIDEGAVIEVLVNPASGLLKWGPAHRQMMRRLNRLAEAQSTSEIPREGLEVRFHETESREHAGDKAVKLARSLVSSGKPGKRLIILAGGDGFHNDICTALLKAVPEIMKDVILFRLPMGTGNDNADAATVEEAFAILGSSSGTRKDSLIEARTARGIIHYAFNVTSFGLDAYVSELTNRMKTLAGPRLIYKIFADVAVLVYEKKWPLKPWKISVSGPGGRIIREGRFLLTIFGRKGDTRYGGGMKVLPGEENFLLFQPLSLMGIMRIKPLFYKGAHRGMPIAEFFKADEVELSHNGPILMETDGEVIHLENEDFPLTLKKVPDVLRILK
ncbi:MAG: hypothetical protein DRZ90_11065 [Spirochaetes bacterium]|nr:MAG: hypothetical protein DRZ90_11065 [Spirochaetota bacterium]